MKLLRIILIVLITSNVIFAKENIIEDKPSEKKYLIEYKKNLLEEALLSLQKENHRNNLLIKKQRKEIALLKIAVAKLITDLQKVKEKSNLLDKMYIIKASIVNIRRMPSLKSEIFLKYKRGEIVIGNIVKTNSGKWLKLKQGGYIKMRYKNDYLIEPLFKRN